MVNKNFAVGDLVLGTNKDVKNKTGQILEVILTTRFRNYRVRWQDHTVTTISSRGIALIENQAQVAGNEGNPLNVQPPAHQDDEEDSLSEVSEDNEEKKEDDDEEELG